MTDHETLDDTIANDRIAFGNVLSNFRTHRNVSARVRGLIDMIEDARHNGLTYGDIAKALAEIGITRQDGEPLKGDQLRVIVARERKRRNRELAARQASGGAGAPAGSADPGDDGGGQAGERRPPHISELLGDEGDAGEGGKGGA